jgi:colanic acid/amylovoran biosynthesis glycosyltransferase
LKIAYFVNQYPKVSHTFIRREILSLERQGFDIQRIALRGWAESLPDTVDHEEQRKTHYVLRKGISGLIGPSLLAVCLFPGRLIRAVWLAISISHRTDRRLLYHLLRVSEACCLLFWLRKSRTLHVHAHFGTNSAEVAMFARCLGGPPFSFTCHGPEEFESPMALSEKVHHSAFVAAISSYGRSQLYLRSRTADWQKVHVVHCGIEPSFFDTQSTESAAAPRLVCVGRLCEAKGQILLVEAAALLRARGIELQLVMAGDGPLRGEIEAAIERHGLKGTVRITGWISSDQVRNEILAARALVLPSFAEGLPVVIMEAMALRRPVLSTFVAGIPELVQAGETGWLFPAGSLDELTAAMEDCLSRTAEEIRRMGDAGFERVAERHSIDVEAGKLAALFRESGVALPAAANDVQRQGAT